MSTRKVEGEDLRLWSIVAATVRPAAGRHHPKLPEAQAAVRPLAQATRPPAPPAVVARHRERPEPIEPGRQRRITRGRDVLAARIDLHGLTQDSARARLETFLTRAQADGYRAALVITGKGATGDGVLRRMAPEWLAGPALATVVAGMSPAHRRHGGEGALYVALKRRPAG